MMGNGASITMGKENNNAGNNNNTTTNNNENMQKGHATALFIPNEKIEAVKKTQQNAANVSARNGETQAKHPYLKRYRDQKIDKISKCKLNCGMEHPETKSGVKRHERVCPNFKVRCTIPNCKELVLRRDMDQHVETLHRRRKNKTTKNISSAVGVKPWQKHKKEAAFNKKDFFSNNNNDGDNCKPWRRNRRGKQLNTLKSKSPNSKNNEKQLPISIHDNSKTKCVVKNNINDVFAKILSHPVFLEFNYITDALKLIKYTSKELIRLYESNTVSTYASISVSLANSHGLFLPTERSGRVEWKKFFYNNLWPSRNKWLNHGGYNGGNDLHEEGQFKINVATRFRPGERSKSRVSLPLHQFLKMRRAAKGSSMPTLGGKTKVPNRLEDDFTGVLMKSPVQLPSSKKFMDRKTLLKILKRDAHDPFNGTPLTPSKVIECPELKEMSRKHVDNVKNLSEEDKDMKVSMKAVETMAQADGENLTSEMIEALMDAERLERAIEKAERRSVGNNTNNRRQADERYGFAAENNNRGNDVLELNNEIADENLQVRSVNGIEDKFDNLNVNGDGQLPGASQNCNNEMNEHSLPTHSKKKEQARVISVKPNRINMYVPGAGVRPFTFTRCFDETVTQSDLYLETGRNVVLSALNGFNSALLTYGQTGSGKTYTIYGGEGWVEKTSSEIDANKPLTVCGIAVRAMSDIFDSKTSMKTNKHINMNISVQYVQIYNDEVFDLGTGNPVTLRKSNGQLVGSSQFNIDSVKEFFEILRIGEEYKHYAETKMNHRSSRAHTILIVTITQNKIGTDSLITSQLQMVDLAGSERIKKSKVVGAQRVEAVGINYSLLCLGKVIKSLVEDSSKHVPYFESKLTTLLKGAFGGNSITSAIITCRINDENAAETLQALYFGERCSMITNTTRNAVASKDAALKTIDQALQTCKSGIQRLEEKGKQHLNVYKELVVRSQNLQIKRNALML